MVNLIINGKDVKAREDMMVLEAARTAGFDIPTLCAHESVSRSGACRLCVVEIKKGNRTRIVTSCLYPVEEGLIVETNTARVQNVRRLVMELLLSRCPEADVLKIWPRKWALNPSRALSLIRIKANVFCAAPVCAFAKRSSV